MPSSPDASPMTPDNDEGRPRQDRPTVENTTFPTTVTRTSDDARRDALAEASRGAGLRLSKLADRLDVRGVDVPLAAEIVGQVVADLARALAREVGR